MIAACQAPAPPNRARAAPTSPAVAPAPPAPSEPPKREPEPSAVAPAPSASPRALLDPASANETAPERFTVLLETTQGELHIDVRRSWAPRGADRFYNLVKLGYYDGCAFFRVVEGFAAQIGIHPDPEVNRAWRSRAIEDDSVSQSNVRGMVSFAASGRNTRTTQFFINLADNARLDALGFAPFGRIRELEVAAKLYAGYGEGAPQGQGPAQAKLQSIGGPYLKAEFPKLDSVVRARVVDEKPSKR